MIWSLFCLIYAAALVSTRLYTNHHIISFVYLFKAKVSYFSYLSTSEFHFLAYFCYLKELKILYLTYYFSHMNTHQSLNITFIKNKDYGNYIWSTEYWFLLPLKTIYLWNLLFCHDISNEETQVSYAIDVFVMQFDSLIMIFIWFYLFIIYPSLCDKFPLSVFKILNFSFIWSYQENTTPLYMFCILNSEWYNVSYFYTKKITITNIYYILSLQHPPWCTGSNVFI